MKSQNAPTMPERRKLLVAGAGIAAASLIPHVSAASQSSQVDSSRQRNTAPGKRKLGKLEVSAVGLGVQNMSRKYDTSVPWRPEMINVIHRAFDQGVTFFDAAEAYGPFEVEKILGEGVAPFRDKIVIATKFGWNIDQQTGKRLPGLNSRPEHIRQVVENMLKRLRTDRIDLLYQHRVDPQIPIEDVAGVVKDLMEQGKVLHWGLSEMGINTLRRAHAALPVTAVQSEYSMLWRGPEKQVIAVSMASSQMDKLNAALNQGLDAGLTINETKEILVQLYAYTGFPRSLNALSELMKVVEALKQRGIKDVEGKEPVAPIPVGDELRRVGTANQTKISGAPVQGPLFDFAPVINQFLQTHLFGDIFARDNLDWQSRELATVGALAATPGVESQLLSHTRASMRVGLTASQLRQLAQVLREHGESDAATRAEKALQQALANN